MSVYTLAKAAGRQSGHAAEFSIEVGFGLKTGIQIDLRNALIAVQQTLLGVLDAILIEYF